MTAELHDYYVAFAHPTGFGSSCYRTEGPLTTYEQVNAISTQLAQRNGFAWCVITNFQLLSTAPAGGGQR